MAGMPAPSPQDPAAASTPAEILSAMWGTGADMPPWMWYYWAVMVFLFGLIFGSFFNVVIYRVPVKKSTVTPGSHCYSCGTFLKWYDNIPLLSYLLLRGNCRSCGAHFSPRYFFVELSTGLMFLALYWQWGPTWPLLFHLAFASLLLIGVFTDVDHYILPDRVTLGGLVFALVAVLVLGRHSLMASEYSLTQEIWRSFTVAQPPEAAEAGLSRTGLFLWSVAGAVFGWTLLWLIGYFGRIAFRKEAMGGGDIKLFAFLGAYLGPLNCIWVLFLSALLGSVVGLSMMAIHKLMRGDEYEHLDLRVAPAVGPQVPMGSSQLSEAGGGIAISTGGSENSSADVPPDAVIEGVDGPIRIRVARRTSRQLDTLPYGPYIAVAAFLILLFHHDVHRLTRDLLMLGPAPEQRWAGVEAVIPAPE